MNRGLNFSSITFLDLLTCGLGGMLLLFFIVVAIRQPGATASRATAQRANATPRTAVLIYLEAVAQPLFLEGGAGAAQLRRGDGAATSETLPQNVVLNQGSQFFLFYAPEGVAQDAALHVAGLNPQAEIRGFVVDPAGTVAVTESDLRWGEFVYEFGALPRH